MRLRRPLLVGVFVICLQLAPNTPPVTSAPSVTPSVVHTNSSPETTSPTEWESLAQTDPIRFLDVCRHRMKTEWTSYQATLVKQERIGGQLQPVEEIDVTVREKPFATMMVWKQGARKVLGTTIRGTLYVAGQNDGKMLVWRPDALSSFMRIYGVSPVDSQARTASRYSITESSLSHTIERTFRAWSQAAASGRFQCEYVGKQAVPELDGRICHILHRTCQPDDVDPFTMTEPATSTKDAFHTIRIMIDAETGLQLGSELKRADGAIIGTYYFRRVVQNPPLTADRFTTASWK